MSTQVNTVRILSPGVEIEGETSRCSACGHTLGPAADAWKTQAVMRETPLALAGGPAYDTGDDAVFLRHYFCPGCAVLLDTETAMLGDPPLVDRLREV
jgi:acetone carboxylase gamma subunit